MLTDLTDNTDNVLKTSSNNQLRNMLTSVAKDQM